MDNLPFNRGFNEALFSLTGPQYYTKQQCRLWNNYDPFYGGVDDDIIAQRNALFGAAFCGHDVYNELYEPQFLNDDTTYIERIFADGTKRFIQQQRESNTPFFVYHSFFTPHFNITTPPNDINVDYSPCQNLNGLRVTICQQILYVQQLIQEIIDVLKDNDLYDNTLIVSLVK